MVTKDTNFNPAHAPIIPNGYPDWRIIEESRRFQDRANIELQNDGKNIPQGLVIVNTQVRSFMLLERLHDYLAYAHHELETIIGTKLCTECCCCIRTTPFITRIEAEYIVSVNGYYSQLVDIAEEWLVRDHIEAPTYPRELPGAVGGMMRNLPQVAAETKALHNLRSPFILAPESSIRRYLSGPAVSGTNERGQNWDLLEDTQPLSCATSGVTKASPEWCERHSGIGESYNTRIIGDSSTVRAHAKKLWSYCEKNAPDKLYFGLLPTMLMMVANPVRFEKLAKSGRIALAKLGVVRRVFPPNTFPMTLW